MNTQPYNFLNNNVLRSPNNEASLCYSTEWIVSTTVLILSFPRKLKEKRSEKISFELFQCNNRVADDVFKPEMEVQAAPTYDCFPVPSYGVLSIMRINSTTIIMPKLFWILGHDMNLDLLYYVYMRMLALLIMENKKK